MELTRVKIELASPRSEKNDIYNINFISESGSTVEPHYPVEKKMSKVKHSIVLLMDPTHDAYNNSLKAGNMLLNRFCIDEDAAFESSGVYYYLGEKASTIAEKEKGKRKYIFIHRNKP